MKRSIALVVVLVCVVGVARSGHELPVYPSYYPHEIEITAVAPEAAAPLLAQGKLHAFVGGPPRFDGAPPGSVQAVQSLGSFLVARANPALGGERRCEAMRAATAGLSDPAGELVFHPYPVTPLHGDFLHHVDLAAAAYARLLAAPAPAVRVKAIGARAQSLISDLIEPGPEWDVELREVDAVELIASARLATNGWLGPAWLKEGWFHALLLLGGSNVDAAIKEQVEAAAKRLQSHDFASLAERINLERELVGALTRGCRALVVGYTLKREYFNAEFSAGIENIAFDSIAGMNSAIFLRTAKLKDFPWNGWLALGIAAPPAAAWNPIAGFGDPFGRLMWSAIGDPLMLPTPYDSAWMSNRISEVERAPRKAE